MLNNIIKGLFALIGVLTGFMLAKTFFFVHYVQGQTNLKISCFIISSLLLGVIFFLTADKILDTLQKMLHKLELIIRRMTLYELAISTAGLIVGLVIANLIAIPVNKANIIGVSLAIILNILFGCLGAAIAMCKRDDAFLDIFSDKKQLIQNNKIQKPKILDTSVIIDGRIVDICRAGFLEGELVVPDFVLEELRHIADSADSLKRNRGRRGLDVLNILQKELMRSVRIEHIEVPGVTEVDDKLIKAARKFGGKVLTNDYNLNKVANIQGVSVLNINELANAVKPITLPGEEMMVQVIKDGKENGQGIGYLDDGTMIVIESGRRHIGEVVNVTVTSVLQTAAGRMIFAKPKQA